MNYTTVEQSKKLLELGLKPESADMYYEILTGEKYPQLVRVKLTDKHWAHLYPEVMMPCWSLGVLLELLREYNDCNKLDIFSNRSQKWQITISYYDVVWKEHEEISINLLEAAYSMVVWLLENGYIKKE